MDAYLFDYLDSPEEHRSLFYGVVIPRLTLRPKVEIMCDFIAHSGLAERFPALATGLRDAVTFRNRCAHSHLMPAQNEEGAWSANEATIIQWRNGEIRQTRLTEADFEGRLDSVRLLVDQLWEFMCAVATAREEAENRSQA